MKTKRIYGDRICMYCKGLCHTRSWRESGGKRRRYWCCEAHLSHQKRETYLPDLAWLRYRDTAFELIDVISK